MAKLLQVGLKKPKEGEIFCKWMHNRLIRNNKNVLGANLGATGSGKSWRDLRMAELWYRYHFDREFPPENICFGVAAIMRRLNSKELERGEVLIFEEAGANIGSLDFQNRVSKIFIYVLQSFRSMNIAVFFNLPYLSMLNKSARMLLHYSFESAGIDFGTGINKCKPFFHQVNQSTGKIYKKYPKVYINNRIQKVKRFNFKKPSKELIKVYEKKKAQYLSDMTEEYTLELERVEKEQLDKLGRPELTDKQKEVYDLMIKGLTFDEIAEKLGKIPDTIRKMAKRIQKRGYDTKKQEILKEKDGKDI